jgi:hypothetical protein
LAPFPLLAAIGVRTSRDKAVCAADTVLLTVPSQLGVEYNASMLETIAREDRTSDRLGP